MLQLGHIQLTSLVNNCDQDLLSCWGLVSDQGPGPGVTRGQGQGCDRRGPGVLKGKGRVCDHGVRRVLPWKGQVEGMHSRTQANKRVVRQTVDLCLGSDCHWWMHVFKIVTPCIAPAHLYDGMASVTDACGMLAEASPTDPKTSLPASKVT